MKEGINLGFELLKWLIVREIKSGILTVEEVEAQLLKKEKPLLVQGPVEN